MRVLVDSSVWSLAIRRSKVAAGLEVKALNELLREGRVVMIGPIRQEILSGIRDFKQFQLLREKLNAWTDLQLESGDYERAAEFFNLCRAAGIQGAHTDFLICAIAQRHKLAILTTDKDFFAYKKLIPIKLYVPKKD